MEIGAVMREAVRVFRRAPGFSLVIVVTLGLGIGANSAIFSLIENVLIQPLPYRNGARLVRVRQGPLRDGKPGNLSPLEVADLRERATELDKVVEYHTMFFNLLEQGHEPERVQVGVVSWDFFDALGVPPLYGRTFSREEDHIGAEPVLVVDYDYWQRRFGGDPSVVGTMVEMNNRAHRLIGVLPPIPTYPNQNDVWMPWYACPFRIQDGWNLNRQARNLLTVGRLAPGASEEHATSELSRIAHDLQSEYGDAYQGVDAVGASLVSLKEELTAGARTTFLVLMGMSALVLLIACANVANLMLTRMNQRTHEIAVQTALGAGRGRILRQLLAESLGLSVAGAVVGVGVAYASVGLLAQWASALSPRFNEVHVDGWVLAFAGLLSLLTGIVIGGLPGLYTKHIGATLREGKGSGSRRKQGVRSVLVAAQVGVAFVLLAGSALMTRSFRNLLAVDPGFDADGVLTVTVDLDFTRYQSAEDAWQFYRALLDGVRALPRVEYAAVASDFPMSGSTVQSQRNLLVDGAAAGGQPTSVNARFVSPGYFETLRIQVRSGRVFEEQDDDRGAPVAVLSRAAADHFFAGGEPVGHTVSVDNGTTWATVVGVVGDIRQAGFEAELDEEIYVPYEQQQGFARRLLVRAAGDPRELARPITEAVYAIDANQPVSFIQTLADAESDRVASPRTITALLGIFALVALVTAAAGILSVIAYATQQRRREIGIRLALGGERRDVVNMLVRSGIAMAVFGLAMGIVTVVLFGGVLRSFLFNLEPTDPFTLGGVAVVVLATAVGATLLPAWRGTRVDPMITLRSE